MAIISAFSVYVLGLTRSLPASFPMQILHRIVSWLVKDIAQQLPAAIRN